MSTLHVGDPGPGEITMLSKAFSSYKQYRAYSHVHSSLRTTTGGTENHHKTSTNSPFQANRENKSKVIPRKHTTIDDGQRLEDVVGVAIIVID